MTLAELDALVAGYRVIRHVGRCFVQVRSSDEVEAFRARGAGVRDARILGLPLWEVTLDGMLDEQTETTDEGDVIDLRPAVCLAYFRERDGFEWPARAEWAT